jgi:hypothetical protein
MRTFPLVVVAVIGTFVLVGNVSAQDGTGPNPTIPSPNGPPPFTLHSTHTILEVTQGEAFDLRAIEAAPDLPGRELLLYVPHFSAVTVGRWHPTKHGIGGLLPGAGFCFENWAPLRLKDGVWNYFPATTGDLDGDGIDDWFISRDSGEIDLYKGRGISSVCR